MEPRNRQCFLHMTLLAISATQPKPIARRLPYKSPPFALDRFHTITSPSAPVTRLSHLSLLNARYSCWCAMYQNEWFDQSRQINGVGYEPWGQLPQGHNIPSVPQYATAPIGIPGPAPTIATEYRFHELRQNPYDRGQLIPAGRQLPTVEFHNFPLGDALVGNTCSLVGRGTFAWPENFCTAQKMAIAFCLPDREPHNHQCTLRSAKGGPPRMERLAQAIARELQDILINKPYVWYGRVLSLDDLVLVRVEHVSKGSLQPVVAVDRTRLGATTANHSF
ncbi:hypothetical protein C8Q76DRAFT_27218 [Earliella scabrosa]|nr:hypothetical protein C8Q76DRAFT_27218 [Earliella scabrosa]